MEGIFETFLGGPLWHNVDRGYVVSGGTVTSLNFCFVFLTEVSPHSLPSLARHCFSSLYWKAQTHKGRRGTLE